MADTDRCDLIEAWARETLPDAVDDLPEDFDVSVSSADGDNAYSLVVEVPQGEGAQQVANSIQSVVTRLVQDDPTLGDRFVEASVTPLGVDMVGSGDAGARSRWELTLAVPEEDEEDSSDEDEDEDGSGEDENGAGEGGDESGEDEAEGSDSDGDDSDEEESYEDDSDGDESDDDSDGGESGDDLDESGDDSDEDASESDSKRSGS